MKKILGALLISVLATSLLHIQPTYADGELEVIGDDNQTATVDLPILLTGIEVLNAVGVIPVKLLVSNGTLEMTTTTGLTFTGPETGAELYFSGDVEDVNAALATLLYTADSTGADTLEVSLVEEGEVFFSGNGHLYEYISVPGNINWNNAQIAAAGLERYGATGYLTTITSQEENDFVAARLGGAGWMGASDAAVEDEWRWVTGPETGDLFWVGDQFGAVVPGEYENWNENEPNDSSSSEDCAQFLSGGLQSGEWNDLGCATSMLPGYVVEFGADGDMPETAGAEFSLTAFEAPEIVTLSPTDNEVDVLRSADLEITFDQDVITGTGNIYIYRTNNDVLFSTIDVESNRVSGSGTETITIEPGQLPNGEDVYIQIDSGAFAVDGGGIFPGINNETTWNFSVKRSSSSETSATPITTASLSIHSLAYSCDSGSLTGEVNIQSAGATEYILSNNADFSNATWQELTAESITKSWNFQIKQSTTTVYLALRNTSGSITSTSASEQLSFECENEVIEEEVDEEESTESPTTGPSPFTGNIELITDITGAQLIRGQNYDTVYLIENGTRRPFMNEAIYFTRFANFDNIKIVTDATLPTIPLGMPVLPKAGTLVKIQSKPETYLVIAGNVREALEYIPSEEVARQRFGNDWATKVMDIDPTLFNKFEK